MRLDRIPVDSRPRVTVGSTEILVAPTPVTRRARQQDHATARGLPDVYLSLNPEPGLRLMELISRSWPWRAEPARQELLQFLLTILAPLGRATKVTDDLRRRCETTVVDWILQGCQPSSASVSRSGDSPDLAPPRR